VESPVGYDGQFFLYIAIDPVAAEHYLDKPGYRYARITYPLAARLASLGHGEHAAAALLLIGILAAVVGCWAIARYLTAAGLSPWYALVYGLSPGLAIAVHRDVAEPLAWALAGLGFALLGAGWRRMVGAAALFGLAGLTHEAALVAPVGVAIAVVLNRSAAQRRLRASIVLAIGVLPALVWRGILQLTVGELRPGFAEFEPLPFGGLIRGGWPTAFNAPELVYAVLLPAVIGLVLVLLARSRPATPALFTLGLATLFVLSLPKLSFDGFGSAGRLGLGTVMTFLLCLPLVDPGRRTLVFVPPALIWAASWMLIAGDVL
jgi:hypothetical protein